MKKTVLTYGLISAVTAAVLLLIHVPFMENTTKGLLFGYAGIVLASLLIFFGIRSYRENVGNGKISFGRACAVGILIALMSAAGYVVAWEVVYFSNPGVADHIFNSQIEDLKAKGAPQAEIDAAAAEVASFKELYSNPVVNAAITLIEPLPVGVLMTLISAMILRRK